MNVADLGYLFEYDRWANARVFAALTDDTFVHVEETLTHIVLVEWVWLERIRGNNPTAPPPWASEISLTSLRSRLDAIEEEWKQFVASLEEADLERRVDYQRFDGERSSRKLAHLLQHVVNHSTYHRGQVATRLRLAGAVPVETDYLHFTS